MAIGQTLTKHDMVRHGQYGYERAAVGDRDGKDLERQRARERAGSRDSFRERMEAESRARRAAFARRVALEETRSLCRRAERARLDQLLAESRALRAAADLRYEASLSVQGQLVAAMRRGL